MALFGLMWILLLIIATVTTPAIQRYPMSKVDLTNRHAPPSQAHWLGKDAIGRDMWSRTIHGARISLLVVAISVTGSAVIRTIIGTLSAIGGGVMDILLQRLTEVFMSLPLYVTAMVLMAIINPGIWPLMLALVIFGWTDTARVIRGEMLSIREEPYVEAAEAYGSSKARIILKHALPGCIPSLLVNATL
ncbi:ABC transporter permease [Candidatus Bipolaricaulota bacterium]|nr:ABC transporter permease [Candidatus Bipolaricaulota bacterium]